MSVILIIVTDFYFCKKKASWMILFDVLKFRSHERVLAMCGNKTRYPRNPIVRRSWNKDMVVNHLFLGWARKISIIELISDFLMFSKSLIFLCYHKSPNLYFYLSIRETTEVSKKMNFWINEMFQELKMF